MTHKIFSFADANMRLYDNTRMEERGIEQKAEKPTTAG
jgi:hypothetical protein